jgi:O-antigen ligase/tetratricopeptide (TPR) repeat protein
VAQNAQPGPKTAGSTLQLVSITLAVLALNLRLMVSGMAQESEAPSVNKFIELFILLAALFYLLSGALSGKLLLRKSGINIPLLAFTGLALLSILQASDFASSHRFALTLLFHAIFFFLLFHICISEKIEKALLSALLASAAVICFIAFYQYFFVFKEVREQYGKQPALAMVSDQMRAAFEERLSLNEAFATFFLSNTLCVFLTIVLPIPLLILLSRLKKRDIKGGEIAIAASLSVIVLFATALTGSRGGWLAIGGSFVIIALYSRIIVRKRLRLKSVLWWASVIALGCIICLFLFSPILSWMRVVAVRFADLLWGTRWVSTPISLGYRLDYWAGTQKMILANPLGVGAANFPDNYPFYKLPYAGEVKLPHNSYLGICAEFGIAGLIAYLAIWLLAARRLLKPLPNAPLTLSQESGSLPVREKFITSSAMAGGVLSFIPFYLLGLFYSIPYCQPQEVLCWAVLWLILFVLISRKSKIFDSPVLLAALVAGLLSFLLHSIIDFDFSCHGINLTVLTVLALLLAHHLRKSGLAEKGYVVKRTALATAALLLAAVIALYAFFYLSGMAAADYLRKNADQSQLAAHLVLKKDPGRLDEAIAHLADAAAMLEKAKSASPNDRKVYMGLAETYQFMFNLIRSQPKERRDQKRAQEYLDKAISNYTAATRLAPMTHTAFHNIALLHISHSDPLTESDAGKAFEAAKESLRLYPTKPQYHLLLGRLYEGLYKAEGGEKTKEKILFHFTEVLRLSKEAPYTNYWLKLSESEKREIEELLRNYGK